MQGSRMGMYMRRNHKTVSVCGVIIFSLLSAALGPATAGGSSEWSVLPSRSISGLEVSPAPFGRTRRSARSRRTKCKRTARGFLPLRCRDVRMVRQSPPCFCPSASSLVDFLGVTPQIDDQPAHCLPLRFRTCQPSGCLAVFSIDPPTLGKMREGSVLKLNVTTAADTQLTFPVSLRGLTVALDRMAALSTH